MGGRSSRRERVFFINVTQRWSNGLKSSKVLHADCWLFIVVRLCLRIHCTVLLLRRVAEIRNYDLLPGSARVMFSANKITSMHH